MEVKLAPSVPSFLPSLPLPSLSLLPPFLPSPLIISCSEESRWVWMRQATWLLRALSDQLCLGLAKNAHTGCWLWGNRKGFVCSIKTRQILTECLVRQTLRQLHPLDKCPSETPLCFLLASPHNGKITGSEIRGSAFKFQAWHWLAGPRRKHCKFSKPQFLHAENGHNDSLSNKILHGTGFW